jgi:hypothetical protein
MMEDVLPLVSVTLAYPGTDRKLQRISTADCVACCLFQCPVCNGRTSTSAARPRAGRPCEVSSILEKHTVAPVIISGTQSPSRALRAGGNRCSSLWDFFGAKAVAPSEKGEQTNALSERGAHCFHSALWMR